MPEVSAPVRRCAIVGSKEWQRCQPYAELAGKPVYEEAVRPVAGDRGSVIDPDAKARGYLPNRHGSSPMSRMGMVVVARPVPVRVGAGAAHLQLHGRVADTELAAHTLLQIPHEVLGVRK